MDFLIWITVKCIMIHRHVSFIRSSIIRLFRVSIRTFCDGTILIAYILRCLANPHASFIRHKTLTVDVWSVCVGLASAFIWLSPGSLMPWSFLVWSLGCISGVFSCFLFDGLAYLCVVYLLFIVAVFHQFASSRHQDSCCWRYAWLQWFA